MMLAAVSSHPLPLMLATLPTDATHPLPLMLATLPTDATTHVHRSAPMLKVVPTGSRQSGLQRRRPLFVGPGQAPHLIRRQSKISKCRPERFTGIDRAQELLTQPDWEPLPRSRSAECPLSLCVRRPALRAAAACVPARRRAMPRLSHRPYHSGGSPFALACPHVCARSPSNAPTRDNGVPLPPPVRRRAAHPVLRRDRQQLRRLGAEAQDQVASPEGAQLI
jgi:hypothetical protein